MTKRTYENETVRVLWDSERCVHYAHCLRHGQGVFDRARRPWVDLSLAGTETIVSTVEGCPSGALQYERLDGEVGEIPDAPVSIVPLWDGPLAIRGEFEVRDRSGEVVVTGPRATLCRCGASKRLPLCDMSHVEVGFTDAPPTDPGNDR